MRRFAGCASTRITLGKFRSIGLAEARQLAMKPASLRSTMDNCGSLAAGSQRAHFRIGTCRMVTNVAVCTGTFVPGCPEPTDT